MAEIVIITAEGKQVQSIPIFSGNLINALEGIEWIDDYRIGYIGDINPSIGEYRIVDVKSGKVVDRHIGAWFRWSPDKKKLAQSGLIVHFAPAATQNYSVQINRETVYSLPKDVLKHRIKNYLTWSPDSKHLAFIEYHDETKKNILIVLAEGEKELARELPAEMKEVQDIEWLDEKIILLREFLPEGGKWKFDLTKQQVEPLDEETKRLLAAKSVEASEREQLIQRLGGQDPDWWFAK